MTENTKVNQLEEYLRSLIVEELNKKEDGLKKADAEMIINNLIGDIDILTARRVKSHFIELAELIIKKFKDSEEIT